MEKQTKQSKKKKKTYLNNKRKTDQNKIKTKKTSQTEQCMAPIDTQYLENTIKANISQMKHHNGQSQLSNKACVRHVPA